ncbi:MAG: glyoxylate/hydroxypyruvate reductase A [Hyphomicrobiaceae bacterium]|nr:MAG: glyoxylate/hydroxypyruvate reductase A [Hyphomicrobiaceae bacterium]
MALLIASSSRADLFAEAARACDGDLDVRVAPDIGRREDVTCALVWQPPQGLLKGLPNLRLIISIGAGVDSLLADPTLPDVPLVRFVDPDLTGRMAEYVALHVLFHHRRMTEFRELQSRKVWKYLPEPAAHEVRVGIMGLGVLGTAAASALGAFGYRLRGWARTPKSVAGVSSFCGADGLDAFLAETDILAVLLPLTPATRGILDRKLFSRLSQQGRDARLPGPALINAGRGGLQIDTDIAAALDAGDLYAASLDVFEAEPLPATSPLWSHPRVVVTPHNAAESAPSAIVRYALRQMQRQRCGEPLENLVDIRRGY